MGEISKGDKVGMRYKQRHCGGERAGTVLEENYKKWGEGYVYCSVRNGKEKVYGLQYYSTVQYIHYRG